MKSARLDAHGTQHPSVDRHRSHVQGQAEAARCGPHVGSPGPAGSAHATPVTPSWQGLPADTPPTPLSSHPIDALDESESGPSGADSAVLSPAQSEEHSPPAAAQQTGHSVPASMSQLQAGSRSSKNISLDGDLDVSQQPYSQSASREKQQRIQEASLLSRQNSGQPQNRQASSSLASDAVILDFAAELNSSSDGLISPSSSMGSWQKGLFQQGSDSSHGFTPLPRQRQASVASQDQSSPGALWHTTEAVSSEAAAYSPGLFPDFAPMFASSPLPSAWQQQHSLGGSPIPAGCRQRQPAQQPSVSAIEPYTQAAAQLQAAVTHAVQLFTACQTASADLGQDPSISAAALSPASAGNGSATRAQMPFDQSHLPFEGVQQTLQKDALRTGAQPPSAHAVTWVPQAEVPSSAPGPLAEGGLDQLFFDELRS